jgi:hypothetical protein
LVTFSKMSEEIDGRTYYGCYMGNHEKFYRWQCKPFNSENEATKFSVEKGNKYNSPFTLLVSVESYVPEIMHEYQIQRKLRQMTNVDIVRK